MIRGTTTIGTQGTEPTRDELRRRQREAFAMRSRWLELSRSDLTITRFTVIHTIYRRRIRDLQGRG